MSSDVIRKSARIVEIHDSVLVLEICSNEACSLCAAKGLCAEDPENKTKIIELQNDGLDRNVGDEVVLLLSSSMGLKGAFLVYFLPVIILLIMIAFFQSFIINQLIIGLISLAILAIYFVLLWLFRKKIEKQISITIE